MTPDEEVLGHLGTVARNESKLVLEAAKAPLRHAMAAGDALQAARDLVADEGWCDWVAVNVDISLATAERYMRVAACRASVERWLEGGGDGSLVGAMRMLVGQPDANRRGPKGLSADQAAEARRLRGEGLLLREVATVLGVSMTTVKKCENPRYAKQVKAAKRRYSQRTAEARQALAQQARVEAARTVTVDGGRKAYANLRKALSAVQSAVTEATDPEVRSHYQRAMAYMHKAEDELAAAFRADV